jgi:hypothetical protein
VMIVVAKLQLLLKRLIDLIIQRMYTDDDDDAADDDVETLNRF